MFGRGRLDHLALEATSLEAFDEIRNQLLVRLSRGSTLHGRVAVHLPALTGWPMILVVIRVTSTDRSTNREVE